MSLQEKIIKYFEGKVVRKDLTSRIKGNSVVPTYVLEYLLGQYCAVDDEQIIADGLEKVKTVIKNNYVHRSESELVKAQIRERGSHKIIDKITVSLNDRANIYEADFANLGLKHVPISDIMVMDNKKLLSGGGVWCILTMGYSHADDTEMRWVIVDLKPIQVANVNTEEYIDLRQHFNTDEWLDLLMHSIGLNPEYFNRRGKLIQISRLITHVENNYNFIELGPKGTGKSHIFSELSPHGVLVSGGDVSKASLFVNNNGNKIGLVGYWDVVCLDEFENEAGGKRVDSDLVKIMQNFMANQSFNRGKESYQATASMAFVGNTKHTVPYMLKNSHLFESIPEGYIKGAFLDRMHMYIPGWEVKILKESVFSSEYGFIVDYLAEVLRDLRKSDYSDLIEEKVELDGSLSKRDKLAIRKSFSGLMKIVYPDRKLSTEELLEILDFAIEGRRRVKDQLYIIDETFRSEPVTFQYRVRSSGKEVEIKMLEQANYEAAKAAQKEDEETESSGLVLNLPKKSTLVAKSVVLKDNQTGVSYLKLFGAYLRGAKKIQLIDPYIRHYYQFKNLLEFCVMLSRIKEPEEEIELHVVSWNSEDHMEDSLINFAELQESVSEIGIHLTYEFQDLHDRSILSENGWKINLGRGLDIFDRVDGKWNVADLTQERRKCKNCEITFLKI